MNINKNFSAFLVLFSNIFIQRNACRGILKRDQWSVWSTLHFLTRMHTHKYIDKDIQKIMFNNSITIMLITTNWFYDWRNARRVCSREIIECEKKSKSLKNVIFVCTKYWDKWYGDVLNLLLRAYSSNASCEYHDAAFMCSV